MIRPLIFNLHENMREEPLILWILLVQNSQISSPINHLGRFTPLGPNGITVNSYVCFVRPQMDVGVFLRSEAFRIKR